MMLTETAWASWLTITGANGYSVTGQAILDYAGSLSERLPA